MTRLPRGSRGQITIPDVVYFAAGLLVIAGLSPVIYRLLQQNSSSFSPGTVMLWQAILPGLLMTMLLIIFTIAVGGGR
jgi:hypothetical protein